MCDQQSLSKAGFFSLKMERFHVNLKLISNIIEEAVDTCIICIIHVIAEQLSWQRPAWH